MGLGSNLGDSASILQRALAELEALPGVVRLDASPSYRTEPQGYKDQPWFLNLVARLAVEEGMSALDLLHDMLAIETRLGRVRLPAQGQNAAARFGPRTVDIDLLLFGSEVWSREELILPHPRMRERAFVLVPLQDLAPELVFPDGTPLNEALRAIAYHLQGDVITQE